MQRKERILRKYFKRILAPLYRAVLDKLIANEKNYGWGNAWARKDWAHELKVEIRQHVEKGDPLDVLIYSAFAWLRGWSLAWPQQPRDCELIQVARVSFSDSRGHFVFELSEWTKSKRGLTFFLIDNGVLSHDDDEDVSVTDIALETWTRARLDALPEYDG